MPDGLGIPASVRYIPGQRSRRIRRRVQGQSPNQQHSQLGACNCQIRTICPVLITLEQPLPDGGHNQLLRPMPAVILAVRVALVAVSEIRSRRQ
ncbi:hypothetical protein D3C76_1307390 [compost metagenome]